MTYFRTDQFKPKCRGRFGLIIAQDEFRNYFAYLNPSCVPIRSRRLDFRIINFKVVREYDGISAEKMIQLEAMDSGLTEGRISISEMDQMLLDEGN